MSHSHVAKGIAGKVQCGGCRRHRCWEVDVAPIRRNGLTIRHVDYPSNMVNDTWFKWSDVREHLQRTVFVYPQVKVFFGRKFPFMD